MTTRSVLARGRAPRLGDCVRCYSKKRATVLKSLTVGDDAYDFPLCETHADLFETQMYGWTRVGQIVTVAAPPPAWTQEMREKVALPAPPAVVEETAEDVPLWSDEIPDELRTLPEDYPGLREWKMSRTARERAGEFEIEPLTVLLAAEAPFETEPSRQDDDVTLHSRGTVTAVVNPSTRTVLTVFRRKEGTIRGSQAS